MIQSLNFHLADSLPRAVVERWQNELALTSQPEAKRAIELRRRIDDLKRVAAGQENVLFPLRGALAAQATVGEVCDALRDVWGTYRPPDIS